MENLGLNFELDGLLSPLPHPKNPKKWKFLKEKTSDLR